MPTLEGYGLEAFRWQVNSVEEMEGAARALAEHIGFEGLVIGLDGPLGAGKTVFVRGLARGLDLDVDQVASPTFTLANEYWLDSRGERLQHGLVHLDFYRIEREEELHSTGFFDYLRLDRVVAVEWASRFRTALPNDRIEIEITRLTGEGDESVRRIDVCGRGAFMAKLISGWHESLERESLGNEYIAHGPMKEKRWH